jgi:hypothetical protein
MSDYYEQDFREVMPDGREKVKNVHVLHPHVIPLYPTPDDLIRECVRTRRPGTFRSYVNGMLFLTVTDGEVEISHNFLSNF